MACADAWFAEVGLTCRLGSRASSRQRRQKREYKLAERVGYLELWEVSAAGQHHAPRARDAGLESAGVRVNVRDVVLTHNDQRRHGDFAQPRQRSRLR